MTAVAEKAARRLIAVALGMLFAFLLLEASLRVTGFALRGWQAQGNLAAMRQKGAYRIMCIGESTTRWQYPQALERILNARDVGIKFSVIDRGVAGATTSVLLSGLESDLDRYQPDMVVAMMGINDQGGYYADIPESEGILFQHLRVYRLARLLWRDAGRRRAERGVPAARMIRSGDRAGASAGLGKAADDEDARLGGYYLERGAYAQAIAPFKRALARDHAESYVYEGLGAAYKELGRVKEAEAILKEGIARKPGAVSLHTDLGWLYQNQGRFKDSEKVFSRALKIRPGHAEAYDGLGESYLGQRDYVKALMYLRKALEADPGKEYKNERLIKGLLWASCFARGDLSGLRPLIERIGRENSVMDDKIHGALAMAYAAMGETAHAAQARDRAEGLRLRTYNPATLANYLRLKEILDRRGIRLACAQYPMRGTASLRRTLRGHEAGVVFIDNQRVFRDAVKRDSYETYFIDMFAGDFGHCTESGNELLARNIAESLLEEVFGIAPRRRSQKKLP